jgi:YD repeat-containing protein
MNEPEAHIQTLAAARVTGVMMTLAMAMAMPAASWATSCSSPADACSAAVNDFSAWYGTPGVDQQFAHGSSPDSVMSQVLAAYSAQYPQNPPITLAGACGAYTDNGVNIFFPYPWVRSLASVCPIQQGTWQGTATSYGAATCPVNFQVVWPVDANGNEIPGATVQCLPPALPDPTEKKKCSASWVSDPVHVTSGAQFVRESDIEREPSLHRLSASVSLFDPGSLGLGWATNYERKIYFPSGGTTALVSLSPESASAFTLTGGTWVPATKSDLSISYTVSNGQVVSWRLKRAVDDLSYEDYDGAGRLTHIGFARGGSRTLSYSSGSSGVFVDANGQPTTNILPAGLLMDVVDGFGRDLHLSYEVLADGAQRLYGATLNGADAVDYAYSNDQVTGAIYADGTKSYLFNEQSQTQGTNLPGALTGIVDENGHRYSSTAFNGSGMVTETELAGGVEKTSLDYSVPGQTTVTDPNATSRVLMTGKFNGVSKVLSASQPAGSGCTASMSSSTWDVRGNESSRDDFDGYRTCNAYDANRNLKTVTLEGLAGGAQGKACPTDLTGYAPANPGDAGYDATHPERKISVQWHPDWALKVRQAEPKKITTWVYNGQPDPIATGTASCAPAGATLPDGKPIAVVCMRYEQSTDDASGGRNFAPTTILGTRAWSYTYNQNGQVLSETAPKLSSTDTLPHTTNYTYYTDTSFPDGATGHTVGDLKKVVDPLGNPTQFTSYDKAGRLLSSTDANGAVTSRTYWARGWLHTVTVTPAAGGGSAQTTTHDYWPTGLLRVVTQPDGSTLTYAYDDAHRLTDVTDGAGNTVHYGLDNVGNRTSETVKDASGNLASAILRVYDNLNRLQAVTGAAQ